MRRLCNAIFPALGLSLLACLPAAMAQTVQLVAIDFNVKVVYVKSGAQRQPLKKLIHRDVTDSRQQKSQDVACGEHTDNEGLLECRLVRCYPDAIGLKSYHINFNPGDYREEKKAVIQVRKCALVGSEVLAEYRDKSIVSNEVAFDFQLFQTYVQQQQDATGRLPDSIEVIENVFLKIVRQDYGPQRLARMRQLLQDSTQIKLDANDSESATTFQGYTTAAANVLVGTVLLGDNGAVLSGKIGDLNGNIAKVLSKPKDKSQEMSIVDYAGLASAQKDIAQGKLATKQFKQIENSLGLGEGVKIGAERQAVIMDKM